MFECTFFSKLLFVPSGVKLSMHKKKSGVFMWTEAKQVKLLSFIKKTPTEALDVN